MLCRSQRLLGYAAYNSKRQLRSFASKRTIKNQARFMNFMGYVALGASCYAFYSTYVKLSSEDARIKEMHAEHIKAIEADAKEKEEEEEKIYTRDEVRSYD